MEEAIYDDAGETFNISSPKQLGVILFEKLKLPVIKKTKTGYSTDSSVLDALLDKHPMIDKILRFRALKKLISTYLDGLEPLISPETGRIHTHFNQMVTATGRLSSSDPNLQNIPIRTEQGRKIRSIFIPGKGYDYIVSGDYSQIELRLLAHLSQDPTMIDGFQKGQDIHRRTRRKFSAFPGTKLRRKNGPTPRPSTSASFTASVTSVWPATSPFPVRKPRTISIPTLPATARFTPI